MRAHIGLPALAPLLWAGSLFAQAPAVIPAVELHLGGDSTQAALVTLRARGVYGVEVTPARASILIRPRSGAGGRPLVARPLTHITPPEGGSVFAVEAPRSGEYIVELTNPGEGPARVRILGDAAVSARNETPERAAPPSAFEGEATVFDETFPGPYATITLQGGIAYRIEIVPEGAVVSVRSVTSSSAPPVVMRPLSEPAAGAGGVSFVLVPSNTDQYRVDVATPRTLVRVRIIRDPREQAYLEGRAGSALSRLTLGLRAAVLAGTLTSAVGSASGATGWEACLGINPGRISFAPRLGGCLATFSRFQLPNDGTLVLMGFEPRYELWSGSRTTVTLAADVAITGKAWGTPCEALTVGPHLAWLPAGRLPILLDLEPGLTVLRQEDVGSGVTLVRGRTQVLARIVAGLHVRL